jgi:hypothetical protein
VLLDVDGGVGEGDDLCLMDIKEGVTAAAGLVNCAAIDRRPSMRRCGDGTASRNW